MLNPLTRWEPGILVHYHGSLTTLHGIHAAHPCDCLHCEDPVYGSHRYRLVDTDGVTIATCIRPRSITPV